MLSAYACVAGICGLSVLIGHLVCRLGGAEGWTWVAPGVGFGAAMCVSLAAVRLPGHGWTVLVLLVVLAAAGAGLLWPEVRGHPRGVGIGLVAALLTTGAVSVPFLLNRRFGVLGAHVDDDLGFHLAWAEALATGHGGFGLIDSLNPGYPIGPHALVAALARPFDVLPAFTGFLMAVPVLTALTALGALRDLHPGWRVLGAGLVGLPYLPVSYFAEGSFKEPALALLVLAFVVALRELPAAPRRRAGLPLGVLALACVLTFGIQALVWPLAALAAWAIVQIISGRVDAGPWRRRIGVLLAGAAGVVALVALIDASRLRVLTTVGSFSPHHGSAGGNFVDTVSPFVGLGGWPVPDFRLMPDSTAKVALATAIVLVALGCALVRAGRRRDWLLPAATASAILVYVVLAATTYPYLSVKALGVAAPLIVLTVVRGLFADFAAGGRRRWAQVVLGLLFAATIAWSSLTALRGASVSSNSPADQLLAQRSYLRHGPTLLLFDDRYARWELLGVRIGTPAAPYNFEPDVPVSLRDGKAPSPLDFDSVAPDQLDRFRYAITVRASYASQPPGNWRVARRTKTFDIWERGGPTPSRTILREEDRPGTVLACAAAAITTSRTGRVAATRPFPIVGGVAAWRIAGAAAPSSGAGAAPLPPGREMSQRLDLPAGAWDLSLRYASPTAITLTAGDLRKRLPAVTDPFGQYRPAGTIHAPGGPVTVTVGAQHGSRGLIARDAEIDAVAATPAPWATRQTAVVRACGRYVDWLGPSG